MAQGKMKLILTVPAHAKFAKLAQEPSVEGVRLNTTIPVKLSLEETLANAKAQAQDKDLWIDLKCRQLRIVDYNLHFEQDHEIHYIDLSHDIDVKTPTEVWFDNGNVIGNITQVINGRRLVIPSSVERRQGIPLPGQGQIGLRKGMSVTILDPSLVVKGYLTDQDKAYVEAAKKTGIHTYMLSFVEKESDITDLIALDKDARIVAKIESKPGMDFVSNVYPKYRGLFSSTSNKVNLMAARGDLYLQLDQPHQIIDACKKITDADPKAILASRLLVSLSEPEKLPNCHDLTDITCGMYQGYRRFMLGDDVCRREDSLKSAIGLFDALVQTYGGMRKWKNFI